MTSHPSRWGRPWALANRRYDQRRNGFRGLTLAELFGRIHRTNLWGSEESTSGVGSQLDATRALRDEIPRLLRTIGAKSLLDVPCGDFGWLNAAALDVDYMGADIVEELVESNRKRYANARRRFVRCDVTHDPLPSVDLVLCRDGMVHLSVTNIFRAFANLKRSGSRYLLATTFTGLDVNCDIDDGDWRPLNLERAPFRLTAPERTIVEGCTEEDGAYADKSLGLWRIADLPETPTP